METFSVLLPMCAGNTPVPGILVFKNDMILLGNDRKTKYFFMIPKKNSAQQGLNWEKSGLDIPCVAKTRWLYQDKRQISVKSLQDSNGLTVQFCLDKNNYSTKNDITICSSLYMCCFTYHIESDPQTQGPRVDFHLYLSKVLSNRIKCDVFSIFSHWLQKFLRQRV